MKATIKDVARYAGVSVATVSRYLNKSPLIAEASVEKVRGAIEALDYQPSMMARGLLHGNSKTVALAVDYSDSETYGNDYFLRIQYGLEHELSKNGYYLMICHIGGADGALTLRSLINENRIDGLVLLSALAREEVMSIVNESRIPCVIAGRSDDPDAVWVDIDNISAGELAAQRLLETKPAATAIDYVRRQTPDWEELSDDYTEPDDDGPDEEEIRYSVAQVKEACKKLPAGYRVILSLYLFEGYDMEEIASILKIRPSSVRSQYLRAKRKLLDIIAANKENG